MTATREELMHHLRSLEVALHQPGVRRDPARLDELLHASFTEFGRSGRFYRRADILELLRTEEPTPPGGVWSQDFAVVELGDGFALLTYKSARVGSDGALHAHALRSSLWERTPSGWQIRFHQGTPTEPFAKNTT